MAIVRLRLKQWPLPLETGMILVLWLAFWLQVRELDSSKLFVDELYEARMHIARPVAENFVNYRLDSHLLHALATKVMATVGWQPFFLRWPSVLAGVLSIALIYRMGLTLLDRQSGVLAALLMGMSSAHIELSTTPHKFASRFE